MKRWKYLIFALLLVSAASTTASANPDVVVGVNLHNFFPLDPEMYGEKMVHTAWGKQTLGLPWSEGSSRAQFFGPNRYNYVLSPRFTQAITWDFGLIVELSEGFSWLIFSPNAEIDVTYQHVQVPILLTPKYEFKLKGGKIRPYLGAGGGVYYANTVIDGNGLVDRWPNPEYVETGAVPEDQEAEEPKYHYQSHRFSEDGWYPGFHFVAGCNFGVTPQLYINLGLEYSFIFIETIYAKLTTTGSDSWKWESEKLKGDAGGPAVDIGVTYHF